VASLPAGAVWSTSGASSSSTRAEVKTMIGWLFRIWAIRKILGMLTGRGRSQPGSGSRR
jgi:hypothetical protein